MYPTGDLPQTVNVTVTLTVPTNPGDAADDWILDAITGSLYTLTFPDAWDDRGYAFTAQQAADMALTVFDTMVIT